MQKILYKNMSERCVRIPNYNYNLIIMLMTLIMFFHDNVRIN